MKSWVFSTANLWNNCKICPKIQSLISVSLTVSSVSLTVSSHMTKMMIALLCKRLNLWEDGVFTRHTVQLADVLIENRSTSPAPLKWFFWFVHVLQKLWLTDTVLYMLVSSFSDWENLNLHDQNSSTFINFIIKLAFIEFVENKIFRIWKLRLNINWKKIHGVREMEKNFTVLQYL